MIYKVKVKVNFRGDKSQVFSEKKIDFSDFSEPIKTDQNPNHLVPNQWQQQQQQQRQQQQQQVVSLSIQKPIVPIQV